MPTRKPCDSSTRPTIAIPKLGWSTYASPVTRMTSHWSQPSKSISSRDIGRNGAGVSRCAQYLRYPKRSGAARRLAGFADDMQLPIAGRSFLGQINGLRPTRVPLPRRGRPQTAVSEAAGACGAPSERARRPRARLGAASVRTGGAPRSSVTVGGRLGGPRFGRAGRGWRT